MKSIILILFNQKKAFEEIGNDYADELHTKSLFIFAFYGFLTFLLNFESINNEQGFFLNLIELVISISFSILILTILSFLIYWIGRRLKGKAESVDIESVIAHSLIPLILGLVITTLLKKTNLIELNWNNPYLRNTILWISILFALNIQIQGLKKFNSFSWLKSLVSLSPIILINIGFLILYLVVR